MTVAAAKQAGRRWVEEVASGLPGFEGAFFHGSINWMSEDDAFPESSDVDVGVVVSDARLVPKLGKVRCDGVIVEGSPIPKDRFASSEQLLSDCQLAHSFRRNSIIADRFGQLTRLQRQVELGFRKREWIRKRCESAQHNCSKYVNALSHTAPYYTQATCWLFAEGNLTHILLVAGLRNPTVRRRYSAARELLASAGRLDVYDTLLGMLGCRDISRARVEHHLERMTEAFDRSAQVADSDFQFASDISELARPVAVGGSRELIEAGEHREAMFWIAATFARCLAKLEADGLKGVAADFVPPFREMMRDLGVETLGDMQRSAGQIEEFLPSLMMLADEIAVDRAVAENL